MSGSFTSKLCPIAQPIYSIHHLSEEEGYIDHAPELALARTWRCLITPISLALFPVIALASLIIATVYSFFKKLTFQELVAHLLIVSPENLKQFQIPEEHLIKVPTQNKIVLDGIKVDKGHKKWLIFLNGFRGSCRKNYAPLMEMISQTPINLLSVDYRGVGFSPGMCRTRDDIIADAEAMVEHLLNSNIQEKDIVVHGYSLGGGVGAQLLKKYPKIRFLSDRSFDFLYRAMITFLSFPVYNVAIARIIRYYWGELNSFEVLKTVNPDQIRLITTPQDIMVDFNQASLYSGYKKARITAPKTLMLQFTHQRKELCGRCFHLASSHYGNLSPEVFRTITEDFLKD